MNITKKTRLAIGVVGLSAAVGLAAGGAFTGTGIGKGSQAGAAQFIGGTVSQSVTGATLKSIVYGFDSGDLAKLHPTSVLLTFTDLEPVGRSVTLSFNAGAGDLGFACPGSIAASSGGESAITCTDQNLTPGPGNQVAINSVAVTVSSNNNS